MVAGGVSPKMGRFLDGGGLGRVFLLVLLFDVVGVLVRGQPFAS